MNEFRYDRKIKNISYHTTFDKPVKHENQELKSFLSSLATFIGMSIILYLIGLL